MLDFVSGKPGAGKSYRCAMLVIDELRSTKRVIVTNLSLNVEKLADYLICEYGQHYDAPARIRILTEEEALCFWLYPGPHRTLAVAAKKKWQSAEGYVMEVPDFTDREGDGGMFALIDEAHICFPARKWQKNTDEGFFYFSQHRKFGDDIILATQFVENVDKRIRSVAQSFYYMRNRTKEALPLLGGLIRAIPGFTQVCYPEPYRLGMESIETRYIKPDWQGIGSIYNTAGGVGVMGRSPEREKPRRGLPWYALALPPLAVGAALYFIPDQLAGVGKKTAQVATQAAEHAIQPVPALAAPRPLPPVPVSAPLASPRAEKTIEYISGFFGLPKGGVAAYARSGMRTTRDPDFLLLRRDYLGNPREMEFSTLRLILGEDPAKNINTSEKQH